MGARYLLIEFDDEAAASRLREQIDNATRKGKGFRVVGLFAKPRNYCRCGDVHTIERGRPITEVKRGRKYGWRVCMDCKRPLQNFGYLTNLLKPRDIINPVKWMSRHWKGTADFEAIHHIIDLKDPAVLGPEAVTFWNER